MADRPSDRGTFAIAGVAVAGMLCCAGGPVVLAGIGGLSAFALGGAAGAALPGIALAATALLLRRHRRNATSPGPPSDLSRTRLIEALYFDGCPSHERLLPTLERLAEQTGARLELRAIETPDAAERERFLGSPTVRIDGIDVDPGAAARSDYGMKCRLYRLDGTQSPTPPQEWIGAALSGGAPAGEADA